MIALSDYLSLKELTTSHVQTQSDTVMTVLSDVDLRDEGDQGSVRCVLARRRVPLGGWHVGAQLIFECVSSSAWV